MTPKDAAAQYGATHYTTMKDGVTPQMYYKIGTTQTTEGEVPSICYLTFVNLWHGAQMPMDSPLLIPINQPTNEVQHED